MEKFNVRDLAYACGVRVFEQFGYDAKACAQRNLSGRTHYADDDTLRFFHARIISARPELDGAAFLLVESVAKDFSNTARGFRFVVFDMFGESMGESRDTYHKTSDKARAAGLAWLESFDVVAHYRAALAERADRLERQAAAMRGAVEKLGGAGKRLIGF